MSAVNILNPRLRSLVRERFEQALKPIEVLPAYAETLFDFIMFVDRAYYENQLPSDCFIILEHLGTWFRYVAQYGKLDDHEAFNDIIVLEMAKVFADYRLSPGNRIQIIYACGNLPYLVQLLEGYANHPFRS